MLTDKYGRVYIEHGVVIVRAGTISDPAFVPTDGLVLTSAEDNLQLRAGVRGVWAAIRFVLHEERPLDPLTEDDDWTESGEAVVTFSTSPYLLVGPPRELNIDPMLQDLEIPPGTYGLIARAKGIQESFHQNGVSSTSIESAPPPEALLQQFRLDLWPTKYPHDLNYDPFSEPVR